MAISIKLLVFVCSITNCAIGKRADFGFSGSHVGCDSVRIINQNEVYTFDEAMPGGSSPFEGILTTSESSNAANVLPYVENPAHTPRIAPPPIPKSVRNVDEVYGEEGLFSPFHAPGVFGSRGESHSHPRPPPALPTDFKYQHDNPEMRKFAAAPKFLPNHDETRIPKRVVKNDMMAGVKNLRGEPDAADKQQRLNTFSTLKKHVQRRPPAPGHEIPENEIESHGNVTTSSSSNLPSYVQHILNKKNPKRTAAALAASSVSSQKPIPKSVDTSDAEGSSSNSLQDILGSLGPDKLDQLRQLLGSKGSSGGTTAPGKVKHKGFSGYRLKRSVDRSFHKQTISDNQFLKAKLGNRVKPAQHVYGNSQPEKCNIQFTKGHKCNRFVFKLEHWVDRVNDCAKEYLQVSDGTTVKKFCGSSVLKGQLTLTGSRVSITHYKNDARIGGTMRFKGGVRCE